MKYKIRFQASASGVNDVAQEGLTREDDVVQVLETVASVGEGKVVLTKEVHESNGVVGGLSLSVGSHAEDDERVLGNLVERVEVVSVGQLKISFPL